MFFLFEEKFKDFIDKFTGFSDLVLDNFRSIFQLYAFFCSIAFVAFCVHRSFGLIKQHFVYNKFLVKNFY